MEGRSGCCVLVAHSLVGSITQSWPAYKELLQSHGQWIDYINWQSYGELEGVDTSAEQLIEAYDRLAGEVGGYAKLTLGASTEPEVKRGAQLPALLEAFRALRAKGLGGAFLWALDNSALSGYEAERALLEAAAA